jgi:hypothetical protein
LSFASRFSSFFVALSLFRFEGVSRPSHLPLWDRPVIDF